MYSSTTKNRMAIIMSGSLNEKYHDNFDRSASTTIPIKSLKKLTKCNNRHNNRIRWNCHKSLYDLSLLLALSLSTVITYGQCQMTNLDDISSKLLTKEHKNNQTTTSATATTQIKINSKPTTNITTLNNITSTKSGSKQLLTSSASTNIIEKRQAFPAANNNFDNAPVNPKINRGNDPWFLDTEPTGVYSLKPYRFVYNVRGKNGQTEQYRREIGDGRFLSGSYGYILPDGIYRHVDYVADDRGFRAFIRTTEPGTANQNPADVVINSNPVPVYPLAGQYNPASGVTSGTHLALGRSQFPPNLAPSPGVGVGDISARFGSIRPLLNTTPNSNLSIAPGGNSGQYQPVGVRPSGEVQQPNDRLVDGGYSPVIDYNYKQPHVSEAGYESSRNAERPTNINRPRDDGPSPPTHHQGKDKPRYDDSHRKVIPENSDYQRPDLSIYSGATKTRARLNPPYQEFSSMDNQQQLRPSLQHVEHPTAEASPKFDDDPYQAKSIGLPAATTSTTSAPRPESPPSFDDRYKTINENHPVQPLEPSSPIQPRPSAAPDLPYMPSGVPVGGKTNDHQYAVDRGQTDNSAGLSGTIDGSHQHYSTKTMRGSDLMTLSLKSLRNTRMPDSGGAMMMNSDWKPLQSAIGLPLPPRNHGSLLKEPQQPPKEHQDQNHYDLHATINSINSDNKRDDHSSHKDDQTVYFDAIRLSSTKRAQTERLSELEKFRQRLKSQQLLLDQARTRSPHLSLPSSATTSNNQVAGGKDLFEKRAKMTSYMPNSSVSYDDESEESATAPANTTASEESDGYQSTSSKYSSSLSANYVAPPQRNGPQALESFVKEKIPLQENEAKREDASDNNGNGMKNSRKNTVRMLDQLELETLSRDSSKSTSQLASSGSPDVIKTEIELRLNNLAAQFKQNWPSLDHQHMRKALHKDQRFKGPKVQPSLVQSLLIDKNQQNSNKKKHMGTSSGSNPKVTNFSAYHGDSGRPGEEQVNDNDSGLLSSSIMKAKQQGLTTSENLANETRGKDEGQATPPAQQQSSSSRLVAITSETRGEDENKNKRIGDDKSLTLDNSQQHKGTSPRSVIQTELKNNSSENNQFNMNLINSLTSLTASHINPFISPASGAGIAIMPTVVTPTNRSPTDGHFATSGARYYTPPELMALSAAYDSSNSELNSLRSALGLNDRRPDQPQNIKRDFNGMSGYASNHRLFPLMSENTNDLATRSTNSQPLVTPSSFENLAMITSEAARLIQNGHRPSIVDSLFSGNVKILPEEEPTRVLTSNKVKSDAVDNKLFTGSLRQSFGILTPSSSSTITKYDTLVPTSTVISTVSGPTLDNSELFTSAKPLAIKRFGITKDKPDQVGQHHEVASQIFSLGDAGNHLVDNEFMMSPFNHDRTEQAAKNHRYQQQGTVAIGPHSKRSQSSENNEPVRNIDNRKNNHRFIEVVSPVEATSFQAFKDAQLSISAVS